jgi:hypothetical protein
LIARRALLVLGVPWKAAGILPFWSRLEQSQKRFIIGNLIARRALLVLGVPWKAAGMLTDHGFPIMRMNMAGEEIKDNAGRC